jgi:hypothetical protein
MTVAAAATVAQEKSQHVKRKKMIEERNKNREQGQ